MQHFGDLLHGVFLIVVEQDHHPIFFRQGEHCRVQCIVLRRFKRSRQIFRQFRPILKPDRPPEVVAGVQRHPNQPRLFAADIGERFFPQIKLEECFLCDILRICLIPQIGKGNAVNSIFVLFQLAAEYIFVHVVHLLGLCCLLKYFTPITIQRVKISHFLKKNFATTKAAHVDGFW